MVVDSSDVVGLKLIAQPVDFVFYAVGFAYVGLFARRTEHAAHLADGTVAEHHHVLNACLLLIAKFLAALTSAPHHARQVVASIANGLQLAYLAHHLAYLLLRLVAEVAVAHLLKVGRNLYLHAVRQVLVALNELEAFVELLVRGHRQQVLHLREHAINDVGIASRLLLRLQDADFGRLHQAALYVLQLKLFLLGLLLLFGQQPANNALHLRNETKQKDGVGHVETRVEHGQHNGQAPRLTAHRRVVAHKAANHVDKGIEHHHDPHHAKDVKQQMGQRRTPRLRASTKGHDVGRGRRPYVFAHHQRNAQIDRQHARGAKQNGDGHNGCRRLHNAGYQRPNSQENNDGQVAARVERTEKPNDVGVVLKVQLLARRTQHHERKKHKGYAKQEVASIAQPLIIYKDDAAKESGKDNDGKIHRIAQRHNPGRQRRPYVGTHNHANGLRQRQQSCRHKRHRHHRRGRRRLHRRRDKGTRQHTRKAVCRHTPQDVAQLRTCHLLQRVAHHAHTIDKQAQSAQQLKNYHSVIWHHISRFLCAAKLSILCRSER